MAAVSFLVSCSVSATVCFSFFLPRSLSFFVFCPCQKVLFVSVWEVAGWDFCWVGFACEVFVESQCRTRWLRSKKQTIMSAAAILKEAEEAFSFFQPPKTSANRARNMLSTQNLEVALRSLGLRPPSVRARLVSTPESMCVRIAQT